MSDREDLNQPDEGDLLRDEVSDEAVEAAASVATGGLPTLWYSTHCFGCPSRPTLGRQVATKDEARRIAPISPSSLIDLARRETTTEFYGV
jgi:hypothetical protein